MEGEQFPSVYLEFPLIGTPFLDVTTLYSKLATGTCIDSDAVSGMGPLINWFADTCSELEDVCFGFELDTKNPALPRAAVHFQPVNHLELVEPFFSVLGEPDRAALYLDLEKRMPKGWSLSFFGLFRGRAGSPLRVCGYITAAEARACAANPSHIGDIFEEVGFKAYDDDMLERLSSIIGIAPKSIDFQFDVYDDGHFGETFAIDVQLAIEQPDEVRKSFAMGPASRVMGMLESWEVADGRWKLAADAAFARSIPVEADEGGVARYALSLMPQWVKARWTDGVLQPAKLYFYAYAGLLS
ncbi:MAG: hypothetical protein ACOYIP_03045 [Coriobacteriales bacterium]